MIAALLFALCSLPFVACGIACTAGIFTDDPTDDESRLLAHAEREGL